MPKTGLDCKMYRSETLATVATDAGYAAMTWIEISNVRDASEDATTGLADVSSRATVIRQELPTLIDLGGTFQMVWDSTDTGMLSIRAAFYASAAIALAFLDGDEATEGSDGVAGNWTVNGFTRNEPLEDGVVVDVTVKARSFSSTYTVPAP